jgi:Tfp pilus assembly protein PilV
MDAPRSQSEAGFGLIELLISMVILQVALLALVASFSASAVALGHAGNLNTAAVLADSQTELYRSMPYDAIGLDTASPSAPTSGMYVSDTGVCLSGLATPPTTCSNTAPRNNANTSLWSCTAASGSTSVSTYFSANGLNPCVAHRTVSGATSPDGNTYFVDTYIFLATGPSPGFRRTKLVSVVVRNAAGTVELSKFVTSFDCSTSQPTASVGAAC